MANTNESNNLAELHALRDENARLKARNADLYRDCVSFAKLIKASAKKDEEIESLNKTIATLQVEITNMKKSQSLYGNSYIPQSSPILEEKPEETNGGFALNENYEDISSDTDLDTEPSPDEIDHPHVQYMDEETFNENNEIDPDEYPDNRETRKAAKRAAKDAARAEKQALKEAKLAEKEALKADKKAQKQTNAKSGGKDKFKALRICISILLAISIIVSIISGVAYLFSTTYKDYAVFGYRFASVLNDSMYPEVKKGDVILIKYCDFEGLSINSLVVTEKDKRSVAKITDLSITNGVANATMKDRHGTYEIGENEFTGKVSLRIPWIGNIVKYASANMYNYIAILASATLLLIAILIILPPSKPKQPKFGRDFTEEDFII